jgi:hypothetical protein
VANQFTIFDNKETVKVVPVSVSVSFHNTFILTATHSLVVAISSTATGAELTQVQVLSAETPRILTNVSTIKLIIFFIILELKNK